MMTKCRRRRTTGYEDRTRLGTTGVSKYCYNGTKNVWTKMASTCSVGVCTSKKSKNTLETDSDLLKFDFGKKENIPGFLPSESTDQTKPVFETVQKKPGIFKKAKQCLKMIPPFKKSDASVIISRNANNRKDISSELDKELKQMEKITAETKALHSKMNTLEAKNKKKEKNRSAKTMASNGIPEQKENEFRITIDKLSTQLIALQDYHKAIEEVSLKKKVLQEEFEFKKDAMKREEKEDKQQNILLQSQLEIKLRSENDINFMMLVNSVQSLIALMNSLKE
ncbi:hypothetical protein LAZ67_9000204 [Cordylochernes scorpioides]|uniref:Uncharacterized protein n=1 Tax=Cordylochernes scorpioides TaxID=51811 RepID=A0ABY6KVP3_9ARAC|nr:hypothetical protein LAZ67_9000204 [Cordylochernes scorpioides]